MKFSDLAAVSGKGGLFKVLKPTRTGAILETLDGSGKKLVVGMQAKVSILSDISIYTTDGEGSVPLQEVFRKVHKEFSGDTGLNSGSEPDELKSFLKFILPNYDEERVYVSDIKKLVNWYHQIAQLDAALFEEEKEGEQKEKKVTAEKKEQKKPEAKNPESIS